MRNDRGRVRSSTPWLALLFAQGMMACGPHASLSDPNFDPNEDHDAPRGTANSDSGVALPERPAVQEERPNDASPAVADPPDAGVSADAAAPPRAASAPSREDVVTFEIPSGLGRKSWNTPGDPVRLRVGQILRIVNRDDTVRHALHGFRTPCRHSPPLALDETYDCEPFEAPFVSDGELYDHYSSRRSREFLHVVVEP